MSSELTLGDDPAEVPRLNAWLDELFARDGFVDQVGEDMKLCINEAVCNIMLYGFADQSAPVIRVALDLGRTIAKGEVSDNGAEFNPLEQSTTAKYTDIESAEPGGFGVQLIRETASQVGYRRDGEWNRLSIVCGRPVSEAGGTEG